MKRAQKSIKKSEPVIPFIKAEVTLTDPEKFNTWLAENNVKKVEKKLRPLLELPHVEITDIIIPNVDPSEKWKANVFSAACYVGHPEMISALLKLAKAPRKVIHSFFEATPIYEIALLSPNSAKPTKTIHLFLSYGLDVNEVNLVTGRVMLVNAGLLKRIDIIKILIEKGASLEKELDFHGKKMIVLERFISDLAVELDDQKDKKSFLNTYLETIFTFIFADEACLVPRKFPQNPIALFRKYRMDSVVSELIRKRLEFLKEYQKISFNDSFLKVLQNGTFDEIQSESDKCDSFAEDENRNNYFHILLARKISDKFTLEDLIRSIDLLTARGLYINAENADQDTPFHILANRDDLTIHQLITIIGELKDKGAEPNAPYNALSKPTPLHLFLVNKKYLPQERVQIYHQLVNLIDVTIPSHKKLMDSIIEEGDPELMDHCFNTLLASEQVYKSKEEKVENKVKIRTEFGDVLTKFLSHEGELLTPRNIIQNAQAKLARYQWGEIAKKLNVFSEDSNSLAVSTIKVSPDRKTMDVVIPVYFSNGRPKLSRDLTGVPLLDAVYSGNQKDVQTLLDKGANVTVLHPDNKGTLLHYAARRRDVESSKKLVELFLERGIPIDARDGVNGTPLHWVAYLCYAHHIKFLITKGADIFAEDSFHVTPLDLVLDVRIENSGPEFLKWLDCIYSFLYEEFSEDKKILRANALQQIQKIIDSKQYIILDYLIQQKVDFNAQDKSGMTLLEYAVSKQDFEAVNRIKPHTSQENIAKAKEAVKLLAEKDKKPDFHRIYNLLRTSEEIEKEKREAEMREAKENQKKQEMKVRRAQEKRQKRQGKEDDKNRLKQERREKAQEDKERKEQEAKEAKNKKVAENEAKLSKLAYPHYRDMGKFGLLFTDKRILLPCSESASLKAYFTLKPEYWIIQDKKCFDEYQKTKQANPEKIPETKKVNSDFGGDFRLSCFTTGREIIRKNAVPIDEKKCEEPNFVKYYLALKP